MNDDMWRAIDELIQKGGQKEKLIEFGNDLVLRQGFQKRADDDGKQEKAKAP